METYKMKNQTEEIVLNKIKEKYPNVLIKIQSDVPDVEWFANYLKTKGIETGLLINAKNPELPLTEKGYLRVIEFCLIENKGKRITFIDAKKLDVCSNLSDIILGELTRIPKKSKYEYLFVLSGIGYNGKRVNANTYINEAKKMEKYNINFTSIDLY